MLQKTLWYFLNDDTYHIVNPRKHMPRIAMVAIIAIIVDVSFEISEKGDYNEICMSSPYVEIQTIYT